MGKLVNMGVSEFENKVLAGERDFRNIKLHSTALRGIGYTDWFKSRNWKENPLIFSGSSLCHLEAGNMELPHLVADNVGFIGAELSGAKFPYSNFSGSRFQGAFMYGGGDFSNSDFSGTSMRGISASSSDFSNSDFSRTKLIDANLHESNVTGIKYNSETDFSGTDFYRAEMDEGLFYYLLNCMG